jgi:hypothetical protein
MAGGPTHELRNFTAFASAREEARQHPDAGAAGVPKGRRGASGLHGANASPSEVTELERRVLAHERILQALIRHIADDQPEILEKLKARFGSGPNLGEYEQNFVSTEHSGDHFIRSIKGLLGR